MKLLVMAFTACVAGALAGGPLAASDGDMDEGRRRVLVLTDIGNEPDDSESFVRFLLYSNMFDIEGIVATTSTWQRTRNQPDLLRERVAAYGKVLPNLRKHADGYPDAARIMDAIAVGASCYGMSCVGDDRDTDGSRRIVAAVDKDDKRPIHLSIWGGAVDLAQALWTVRKTRTPAQVAAFISRLRVYSISDQDDAGPWARRNFPELRWVASVHGWGQYGQAAWTGISADLFAKDKWPGGEMVTNDWLERNVRKGVLGQLYPPHMFIMEGDTPAFLGTIPNGLNFPDRPDWGGWGGRYVPVYEGAAHHGDTPDAFTDSSGRTWRTNQATIFRWREAFQNDFAARINWTLTPDRKQANHNPQVVVNGAAGQAPVKIEGAAGATLAISAKGSMDPDGNALSYRWWQYAEPSDLPGDPSPKLAIANAEGADCTVTLPAVKAERTLHLILEVRDGGSPALTSYRRVLVTVRPAA